MILADANLLLYAYDTSSSFHESARRWLESAIASNELLGLPWVALLAFLRIGTSARVLRRPFSFTEAAIIIARLLEQPLVTIPNPGERHWEILRDLVIRGQAEGPLIMDAHLAALAIEHGGTLATADRDFARFPGLRILNPIES